MEPVKDFAADALKSQDTGKTTGTGSTSQLLNRYKDSFTKKHVVVIKSQMGTPIEVFNGDTIKWDIDDNLPKTTRLMVDDELLDGNRNGQQLIIGVLHEDFRRVEPLGPVVELFLRKTGVLSAFRVES